MNASKEIKDALIHLRRLQTWLNKNSSEVSISKKFTYPKEARLLNLNPKSLYSYLDIVKAIYKYIDENGLSENGMVKLDKKLKVILKTNKEIINIYQISNLL